MKPKSILMLMLVVLVAIQPFGFVAAQEAVTEVQPVPVSAFANDDVSSHHLKTLEAVKSAISDSEELGRFQKKRLLRRLERPHVAVRVTDAVTSEAMTAGYISLDFDADTQQVETNVDWDGLIEFIERLIPLIVELIGLFG